MKKICLVILLLVSLLACGCTQTKPQAAAPVNKATDISYSVVDDAGRTLHFAHKPQRIVSLTYGTDEILSDLVDLKRIVGYSRWAGDSEISFITKDQAYTVGRKVNENTEAVFALQPDLVVVSVATSNDLVSSLEGLGVPVYISRSPKNYNEMCAKIMGLAHAVGEADKGRAMVQRMDVQLQQLERRLSRVPQSERRVAVAFNFTSAMGRKGDLLDSMLTMAHVINGAAVVTEENEGKLKPQTISKEQVVRINPDIFLLPTWNYNNKQDVQGYAYAVMNDPAYKNVKAVQNKQLKFVSDKYRYVASQHIVDAIENIARAVYPEIF